ncbi:MAG: hypothetical protein NXI01_02865 [Gammaproteobacteria bacterium]|nr:hypothetical protein [Gammaproteobacteria bacterium]
MNPKSEYFDHGTSPIDLAGKTQRTTANPDVQADWERLSKQKQVYVNGKELSTYRESYNNFAKKEHISSFFEIEILSKATLSEEQKKQAVDYLTNYMTQSGFMYPISNILVYNITKELGNIEKKDEDTDREYVISIQASANRDISEQQINISSDEGGFSIQEFVKVSTLKVMIDGKHQAPDLKPDKGTNCDYLIKAQGTLGFDFRENASDPTLIVRSNTISYGNSLMRDQFDNRDWMQRVLDFIANVLGLNRVNLINETQLGASPQETAVPKDGGSSRRFGG